jgi:hypothetical protein
MMVIEHEIQTFEVVVVVLLLFFYRCLIFLSIILFNHVAIDRGSLGAKPCLAPERSWQMASTLPKYNMSILFCGALEQSRVMFVYYSYI